MAAIQAGLLFAFGLILRKKILLATTGATAAMVLLFPSVASVDQPVAGVDILDINIGAPGIDEVSVLPEIAPMVVESIDRPIYLISANRGALAVIVSMCPGKS